MFLKCGQKENTKYTFGLRKEQREEKREIRASAICCSSCGKTCKQGSKFCPACGGKL